MNELLILLAISLLVCICFMAIETWLYIHLERDFAKQKQAMMEFAKQFDNFCKDLRDENKKATEILEEAGKLNKHTRQLVSNAEGTLKKANDAAEFSMKTAQEARKSLRNEKYGQRIVYENGKPVEIRSINNGFKYEEKEEDPEEPRS